MYLGLFNKYLYTYKVRNALFGGNVGPSLLPTTKCGATLALVYGLKIAPQKVNYITYAPRIVSLLQA